MAQHLYLMVRSDAPGLLKIGRSKDPANRAKQLETSQCFHVTVAAVFEGAGDLEPYVHSKLAACRELGGPGTEWFRTSCAAALCAVGEAMDASPPQPPASSASSSPSSSSSSPSVGVDGGRVVSAQHAYIMWRELDRERTLRGCPLRPVVALRHLGKLSKRAAHFHQQKEMARLDALTEKWVARAAALPQDEGASD